nr:hypothetical protein [Ktedonobacteraceae bacterium]
MITALDAETHSLLETLAAGFYQDEICMCCRSPVFYTQEGNTYAHVESCPTRRARILLAANGTPVKMWIISYSQRGTNDGRISTASLRVMRCELSADDAIALVREHLVFQGKRELLEESVACMEIPMTN